jgi:hypothetical protein
LRNARYPQTTRRSTEILLFEWDPIGVKDASSTQDEYDSYALPIVQAILKRRNVVELRDQLLKIEVELMGLEGDPNRLHS